ncbi:MAG: helix-turn-helix domain-containing protein, partial [Bacteroidota bacterium]
ANHLLLCFLSPCPLFLPQIWDLLHAFPNSFFHFSNSFFLFLFLPKGEVISGKWKFPIITALCHEELRYSELEKRIPKITPRMLSKELKELELNNLIERKVYDTIPVRVTYKRTEFSTTLLPVITELIKWGIAHREKIMNIKREDNKV